MTPGNPLWFFDLLSLLSQPEPAPQAVKVNLIPVREWKRSWNVSQFRPPVRRRRRRHHSATRVKRPKLSTWEKQRIFLVVSAILTALVIANSLVPYRSQLSPEESGLIRRQIELRRQVMGIIRPHHYEQNGSTQVYNSDGTPHTITVWKRVDD